MRSPHVDDELPFYLNETLPPAERERVEQHLATCPHCQEELAFWRSVAAPITEARQASEADAAVRAPSLPELPPLRLATAPRRPLRRAATLLQAQWSMIWRQAALASGVILAVGLLILPTLLTGTGGPVSEFLRWLAPLATALGVALVYSPAEREAAELLETMPTSPRTVLLARLALLYSSNAAVVWLIALALGQAGLPVAALATGWLLPMALLSTFALLVAILTDPSVATLTISAVWIITGAGRMGGTQVADWVDSMTSRIEQPAIALPVIAVQLLITLWWVGRPNVGRYRTTDS